MFQMRTSNYTPNQSRSPHIIHVDERLTTLTLNHFPGALLVQDTHIDRFVVTDTLVIIRVDRRRQIVNLGFTKQ